MKIVPAIFFGLIALGALFSAMAEFGIALSTGHSYHASTGLVELVTSVIFGLFAFLVMRSPNRRRKAVAPSPAATYGELRPLIPTTVIPKPGELFYHARQDVAVLGEHLHSTWRGGSAGLSFRIARGVYAHTGRSRSHRVSQKVIEVDDVGLLAISQQRLLFIGKSHTYEIPLSRIVNVVPYPDGLRVDRANAKPLLLVTKSVDDSIVLARIMQGDFAAHAMPAPPTVTSSPGQIVPPNPASLPRE